jgi:hypothetical protein
MKRQSSLVLAALSLVLAAGCGGTDPTDLFPSTMQAVSPTTFSAKAGTAVTVQVRILTDKSVPLGNIPVSWAPGLGDVLPLTSRTDAQGIASTVWTLANQVGQQSVTATAQFVSPVTFTATATQQ